MIFKNVQRHKLLKKLRDKRLSAYKHYMEDTAEEPSDDVLSIKFDALHKDFDIDRYQFHDFYIPLLADDEVRTSGNYGIFISNEGMKSYSNKRYIKMFWGSIREWIKNFIQIIIPVGSIYIAYLAFTFKQESLQKELHNRLDKIEQTIPSKE